MTLDDVDITSSVLVSDKNFTYVVGGIYLIKRYSSYLPAKCVTSSRSYRHNRKFEHVFMFLETRKRITFLGNSPARVYKKLCDTGEIGKSECDTCPIKFKCYTVKKL